MRIGEIARRTGLHPSAIRFSEETELYLGLIGFARQAGFSIAEIRTLFQGFRAGTPASARWQRLARKKHRELGLMVVKLKSMQTLLKKAMRCKCMRLADCGRIVLRDT